MKATRERIAPSSGIHAYKKEGSTNHITTSASDDYVVALHVNTMQFHAQFEQMNTQICISYCRICTSKISTGLRKVHKYDVMPKVRKIPQSFSTCLNHGNSPKHHEILNGLRLRGSTPNMILSTTPFHTAHILWILQFCSYTLHIQRA